MSYPKSIVKAIQDQIGMPPKVRVVAALASRDLHADRAIENDASPGFETALRIVRDWLGSYSTLYVADGCVSDVYPNTDERDAFGQRPPVFKLDQRDIASILFGHELARYL